VTPSDAVIKSSVMVYNSKYYKYGHDIEKTFISFLIPLSFSSHLSSSAFYPCSSVLSFILYLIFFLFHLGVRQDKSVIMDSFLAVLM
jgi:hypothetical protein